VQDIFGKLVLAQDRKEAAMTRYLSLVVMLAALMVVDLHEANAQTASMPDFGYYKSRVEPIFLRKKAGHTRCYVCHSEPNRPFRLQRLAPGRSSWTPEQSKQNFEIASALVTPGDPDHSRLLIHPLAPEGGGDAFHSGGRQFASKGDPDWRILAAWVNGAKDAVPAKR
jgi:hypothetical protein